MREQKLPKAQYKTSGDIKSIELRKKLDKKRLNGIPKVLEKVSISNRKKEYITNWEMKKENFIKK